MVVVAAILLILLALPIRAARREHAGPGRTGAGSGVHRQGGDTLASIADRADPAARRPLTGRLAREVGSTVGRAGGAHLQIP